MEIGMKSWSKAPWITLSLVLACGDGGPGDTQPVTGPGTPTTQTTSTGSGPGLVQASLAKPGTGADHLTRLLSVTSDAPSTVVARLTSDDGIALTFESTTLAQEHELQVLGLRFGRTWTGQVDLVGADGGVTANIDVGEFTTDPEPDAWPDITVFSADADQMEPGVTLFALNDYSGRSYFLIAMDAQGEVVWLYDSGSLFALDAHIDQEGRIIALLGNDVVLLDWMGNELGRWNDDGARGAIPVAGKFHHEAYAMPNGNLLSLTRDKLWSKSFPSSYTDPAARVAGEVMSHNVVEFAPDGSIVFEHSLWDIIDRERIAYDSLLEATGGGFDWVHSNAVYYQPDDDSYVVSLRHQDALIKIDRPTGALKWILGTPENWGIDYQPYLLSPDPGTEWPFHPHGPMLGQDGRIYVFDNGNYRVSPWTGDPTPDHTEQYSRLVAYEVDEQAMTVRQVWDFDGPGDTVLFSYATGDADLLPQTGHVLGTFGFTEVVDGLTNESQGLGRASSRLVEVDPSTDAVVWDVWFTSDFAASSEGWHGYRATRVPFP